MSATNSVPILIPSQKVDSTGTARGERSRSKLDKYITIDALDCRGVAQPDSAPTLGAH
jgi:hypothetical protein